MNAEIHKIDLKALFFRILKIPTVKNLDIWVSIQSVKKNLDIWVSIQSVKKISQGITDFTEANFKIWSRENTFRL